MSTMSMGEKKLLEAKRDELALALAEGEPVQRELERAELELYALSEAEGLTAERQSAAARASARRAAAEADRAERERRRALQDELRRLAEERGRLAAEVEEDLTALRAKIDALMAIGTTMYTTSAALGTPHRRFQLDSVIQARLASIFWPMAGPRPDISLRKALPDMMVPVRDLEGPGA